MASRDPTLARILHQHCPRIAHEGLRVLLHAGMTQTILHVDPPGFLREPAIVECTVTPRATHCACGKTQIQWRHP